MLTPHTPLAGFRIHSGQLHSNFFKKYEKETTDILNLKPAIAEKILFNLYKIYNNLPLRLRVSKYFNKKMPALSYDLGSNTWK